MNKKPRMPIQIQSNWSILFKFMEKEEIELGGITALSLSQGRQKTVMALIWRFIQKYDLAEVIDGLEEHGGIDGLLQWMKPRVDHEHGYPGFNNFTSHLKDGVALLALYDNIFPEQTKFKIDEIDGNKAYDNLKLALDLFEEDLGVPQLIRPEDVTGKNETKKGNVTYIIQIRNAVKKKEERDEEEKKLREKLKNDEEGKRIADNLQHYNRGDELYQQGLTKQGATNGEAEETVEDIMKNVAPEKFAQIGDSDEEYAQVVDECTAMLDKVLEGFDQAKGKFGEAEEEYGKIVPPTDLTPTPEKKIQDCHDKEQECDDLKEKYKLDFQKRLDDAIRNDKGKKKLKDAQQKHTDGVFEGGDVLNQVLEQVKKDFDDSHRPEQRELIAAAAVKKIADEADRIFDPIKSIVMEAEDLLDDQADKAECRTELDKIDASKAQMMENIRIKIAELKAAAGEADEMTPDELLQLYHDTSNKIAGLLHDCEPVDEGIPDNATALKKRLQDLLDEVSNIFGSKDTLRAKVHASVDEVFDRNGLH